MLWIWLAACKPEPTPLPTPVVEPVAVRVATFNTSLFGDNAGEIASRLAGEDVQASRVAAVLQIMRPDIVLINELDADADGSTAQRLHDGYFAVSQDGREALDYPYIYVPSVNTGVHSGLDLDNDGSVTSTPGSIAYGGDAYGFGQYEGQYGFAVFSRYPLGTPRTFQNFLWQDLPDNLLPTDWYAADEVPGVRLSSKTHADVVIDVDGRTLHLLASHPTPPAFDGPEDRNGKRNHDEIKLWADYLDGGPDSYHVDDAGVSGALGPDDHFVVVGDLNADPNDGDSVVGTIQQLLDHPRVASVTPISAGAAEQSTLQGGRNGSHTTPSEQDTADFNDQTVGNLRLDYALPSNTLTVVETGVFWPLESEADFELVGTFPFPISDHRLVYVDVEIP